MKKNRIVILIFLTLILSCAIYYVCLFYFGNKIKFSTEPQKPKFEIPITYNIGWWSDQKTLSIDSLQIEIVESKLNLFNSKSLISYKIKGNLTFDENWQHIIKEIHISERLNFDTTLNYDRIIEITPVIVAKENKKKDSGINKFKFKNEHTIISNHWGANRIKFICGGKEEIIELYQRK
jgi:hypothetical protein